MDKIMAIYDSDVIYATRFMEFFKKKNDNDFNITVFSRKESIEDFLKSYKIEILLFGNDVEMDFDEHLKDQVKYSYRLVETNFDKEFEEYPAIFKYQKAQLVMNEVVSDYHRRESETGISHNSGTARILSIYTPIPDLSSLLFTWSLSLNHANNHKTLLIPLEYHPISLFSSEESTNQSLSEVIYYLKERNPNTISKMIAHLHYNSNLSYLTGLTHGFDLLSLGKEDIQSWIEQLQTNTDFKTIIFYTSIFTEAVSELLLLSDQVLLVTQDNLYSKQVLKEWERQSDLMGIIKGLEKFEKISLKNEVIQKLPLTLQELQSSRIWSEATSYQLNL